MKVKTMTRMALLRPSPSPSSGWRHRFPCQFPGPRGEAGAGQCGHRLCCLFPGRLGGRGDSVGSGPAGLPGSSGQMMSLLYSAVGGVLGASDRPGPEADFDRNANLGRQLFQCGGSQPGTNCRRDCHHPDPGAPVLSASPFGIRPAHWPLHRTRRPDLAPASP